MVFYPLPMKSSDLTVVPSWSTTSKDGILSPILSITYKCTKNSGYFRPRSVILHPYARIHGEDVMEPHGYPLNISIFAFA